MEISKTPIIIKRGNKPFIFKMKKRNVLGAVAIIFAIFLFTNESEWIFFIPLIIGIVLIVSTIKSGKYPEEEYNVYPVLEDKSDDLKVKEVEGGIKMEEDKQITEATETAPEETTEETTEDSTEDSTEEDEEVAESNLSDEEASEADADEEDSDEDSENDSSETAEEDSNKDSE